MLNRGMGFLLIVGACVSSDVDTGDNLYGTATSTGSGSSIVDCTGFTGNGHMELGSGTETDPYVLCNAEQVDSLRQESSVGGGTHYRLGADIDLAGIDFGAGIGWCDDLFPDPIGGFKGTFDGAGHTVSNLFAERAGEFSAFIGCLNGGILRDIVFDSPRILWPGGTEVQDGYWRGVAVGYAVDATLEDLSVMDGQVAGSNFVGGVAGTARGSVLSRVGFEGQVGGELQSGYGGVLRGARVAGGLVGKNEWSSVVDSYSWGSVHGERLLGGMFGSVNDGEPGMVLCRNFAAVDAVITGEDEDPRPGILVSLVELGEPSFGAQDGEGLCASDSVEWTVFGMQSDNSSADTLVASGPWNGSASAETFDALCQVQTYEDAGWDFSQGAWNPPTGDVPPTLR